ncbi:hypothetical protein CXB51_010685 [Gossypium anomalum]|uniref:Uncharacterized protein n=1 Tax=Gossypium anomalum TaxID=47600 RepID=A0A8J6D6U8_9ROSI|nr:hypothetical protein CXB51_010685 [Gossypium anomalum]
MLTTKFETLRRQDFKTIDEFYANLYNLSNYTFSLGEQCSNSKLVRKVLRSLLKRFSIKVTAIVEAKGLESLKIDELIGSFQTFKLNKNDFKKVKFKGEKSIEIQVIDGVSTPNVSAIKKLQEQIAISLQNFNKAFKKKVRRFKKFETSKNTPKNKSNGVFVKSGMKKTRRKASNVMNVLAIDIFR